MNILLGGLAIILTMGMIADESEDIRYSCKTGLIVCITAIVVLNIIS